MTALIVILQYLAGLGIDLRHFDIVTVKPSEAVYECEAYAEPDATILVCYKEKLIRIVKE